MLLLYLTCAILLSFGELFINYQNIFSIAPPQLLYHRFSRFAVRRICMGLISTTFHLSLLVWFIWIASFPIPSTFQGFERIDYPFLWFFSPKIHFVLESIYDRTREWIRKLIYSYGYILLSFKKICYVLILWKLFSIYIFYFLWHFCCNTITTIVIFIRIYHVLYK